MDRGLKSIPGDTMEIFAVDGFPETKVALALFKSVKNAAHLKSTYLNRVALIDAGLVLSVFQLRVAAAMTLEKQTAGKMKTRSLPSELVWSLSGSKNIAGSLQTFSVQEVDNADLLVAAIDVQEDDLQSILEDVQGEPRPLGELGWGLKGVVQQGSKGSKREKWKKMYKITDEELAISSLEDCVVMRMAVKDH